MRKVLLIRYGEIHLKGGNRPYFERLLIEAIRNALSDLGAQVVRAQGRYYATGYPPEREREAIDRLTRVFGIYSVSPAREVEKDWDAICAAAVDLMTDEVARRGPCTFKVNSRRADKSFPMDSMHMAPLLGGYLLEQVPGLTVDVKTPQLVLGLEIRENAYLYTGEILCAGGMPAGSSGRAALLLSGGIDSPVAGHMVMKRGVSIDCIHFHSFPYTSERAREKVIALTRILARFQGCIRLHIVHFTDVQLAIYEKCPESQTTVLIRRAMMRIAQRIAAQNGCKALVTGESIGQVASQTLDGLCCTDAVAEMPVFRPCIGFDKVEIMDRARAVGTYDTSILPYEDCCTIFTPKHPVTHPRIRDMEISERKIDNYEQLLLDAIEKTEAPLITPSPISALG